MYQANTGAYEPPTGKCPDINLILHRYRYIERRSFLEPKQRKEPHSLFTLAFYPVIRLSVWKAYVIIAFTCMLACDFFNKLNMYWYSHWSNPYANHHQYYDIGSKIHKLVELMFAPVRSILILLQRVERGVREHTDLGITTEHHAHGSSINFVCSTGHWILFWLNQWDWIISKKWTKEASQYQTTKKRQ